MILIILLCPKVIHSESMSCTGFVRVLFSPCPDFRFWHHKPTFRLRSFLCAQIGGRILCGSRATLMRFAMLLPMPRLLLKSAQPTRTTQHDIRDGGPHDPSGGAAQIHLAYLLWCLDRERAPGGSLPALHSRRACIPNCMQARECTSRPPIGSVIAIF